MSRIVVTTVGTTGDVVPYVALCRGLKARGHDVRLVSHALHRGLVERHGIDFVAESDLCTVDAFNQVFDEAKRIRDPLAQFSLLLERLFLKDAQTRFSTYLDAVHGADLVAANGFDFLGQEAAIQSGVRWASISMMPHLIPTDEAPVYPMPNLGGWWIRSTWKTLYAVSHEVQKKTYEVLKKLGAAPRSLGVAGAISADLHLVAASEHLTHRRSDWPRQAHMTGAWHLEPAEEPEADPELSSFLSANPSPIAITFGSMGGTEADETSAVLTEAIERVRQPAIIQGGYSGLSAKAQQNVLCVGFVPHDFLFSRASCVVHHAGAGTTLATALAGVPSVPVPHLFDQSYWAGMLHERGVGTKPLFRHKLSAKRLARAINAALVPEMRERAQSLASRVRTERGVENAVSLIEGHLKGA